LIQTPPPSPEAIPQNHRSLFESQWTFALILAILLGAGAVLRFSDLSAPLLDFHPTRQLFGAIKARGIYYQTLPTAPAWQKDIAVRQVAGEATIEPPLMEYLSAALYAQFGEQTAIPRALSATFWLFGGLFVFLLAKNLAGSVPGIAPRQVYGGAAASLAFYLLLPYAVTASRSFQPDPLMVTLIILFWWSIENWGRNPSWKWSLLSALAGGLAMFIKLPAAFFVIGGALAAIFAHLGLVKSLKLPQTWVTALLGCLPPAAYLYYGTFMHGFLDQQFSSRFYPEMWVDPFFYLRWFLKVENVASILWIALALISILVFASKPAKIFLASLWVAYLVYGMSFAHHISSHDYYSLPLIPILAVSLAPLAAELLALITSKANRSRSLQAGSILLLLITISLLSVDQYINQRANDYRQQAAFWATIGGAIGHQPGVVALTSDYGYPLAYYGWQKNDPWPLAPDIQNFDETFSHLAAKKSYFLITDFDEYERQPELQKRLSAGYPILAQGKGYIVFDLLHPKK
jgi:hypothetical protein